MRLLCTLIAVFVAGPSGPARGETPTVECPAILAQAAQAADAFLWAWMTCDAELGRQLLSADLQRRVVADSTGWFQTYMSGMSNPHPLAFEVTGGTSISGTRARFRVALFEHYEGESTASRRDGTMELVLEPRSGSEPDTLLRNRVHRLTERLQWRVDVLPVTPYGPK